MEFDKRQELLMNNVDRLCGLAMFFGELFLVLEVRTLSEYSMFDLPL